MLKIAICDDEKVDRDRIRNILIATEIQWNMEFYISQFSSGEEFLVSLMDSSYDIILLDIKMNGVDGIEVARRLKQLGSESLIIFISSYDERVKELFWYRIIAFLDKPIGQAELKERLQEALEIIKSDSDKIFTYKQKGDLKQILLKDILYLEVDRNYINLYTKSGKIRYLGTLSETWDALRNNDEFIKPNQSYIFNLKYVTLKANHVILTDGTKDCNIGRNFKEDTHARYFNYIRRRST